MTPAIVGVLITAVFCLGAAGLGRLLVGRWLTDIDRAARPGICGLTGLGAIGLLSLAVGLLPGGLLWGLYIVGGLVLVGLGSVAMILREIPFKMAPPKGLGLLFPIAIGLFLLFSLVGVLSPSDTMDWDTLAYHLAVPKLWLAAGQIQFIPSISHSNFPCTADVLYVWGLQWGGQYGAKAFSLAFFLFGLLAIFGLARQRYGTWAGWWSALAFASIPVVVWESGTAYIDVAHGVYAGLGIVLVALWLESQAERRFLYLGGIMLGFAAGTKYTGLQTLFVVCVVILAVLAARKEVRQGLHGAFLVGLVAVAVSAPWYIKNIVNTGNPVYPFFFEKLGGKNWDQRRADIYRNEQQTFGVGRTEKGRDALQIGAGVLGLAYQPGRFVNPGQDSGLGTPLGAVGVSVLVSLMFWLISGKMGRFESAALCSVVVSLLPWYFLSQQSRYFVPLSVPLCVLAGGAVVRLKMGQIMAGVVALQSIISLYIVNELRVSNQLPVVVGKIDTDQYQKSNIAFYEASLSVNESLKPLGANAKVALYDEVFGFLLDVPYMWANPGHSTLIPYDKMTDGMSYTEGMKKLGFTHVYISLSPIVKDPAFVQTWLAAMGLPSQSVTWTPETRNANFADWQSKWQVLLADAVREGRLEPQQTYRHGILFRFK